MKTSQQNKDMKRLVSLLLRKWCAESTADAWQKRADNYVWSPFGKNYEHKAAICKADADLLRCLVEEQVGRMVECQRDIERIQNENDRLADRFLKGRDNIHAKADMSVLLTNIFYEAAEV